MEKYTLRTIDPDLWREVKTRVKSEGRTIRFVILELLKAYAAHGLEHFRNHRK